MEVSHHTWGLDSVSPRETRGGWDGKIKEMTLTLGKEGVARPDKKKEGRKKVGGVGKGENSTSSVHSFRHRGKIENVKRTKSSPHIIRRMKSQFDADQVCPHGGSRKKSHATSGISVFTGGDYVPTKVEGKSM